MSIFGWCADRKHEACIRQYHSLSSDAFRVCSCSCHSDNEPTPKRKGW